MKKMNERRENEIPKLLKADEVAETLNIGRSTVYQMLRRNEIPCIRIGRAVRVRQEDLESFIDQGVEEELF